MQTAAARAESLYVSVTIPRADLTILLQSAHYELEFEQFKLEHGEPNECARYERLVATLEAAR